MYRCKGGGGGGAGGGWLARQQHEAHGEAGVHGGVGGVRHEGHVVGAGVVPCNHGVVQISLNTSYLPTIKYTLKRLMSCIKVYNCQLSTYKAPDPQNNKAKLHTRADIIIFFAFAILSD